MTTSLSSWGAVNDNRQTEMKNALVLVDTLQTLCQGIEQQQQVFSNDHLVNPLLAPVMNPEVAPVVNPVVAPVVNPEAITLYHFASRGLRSSIGTSIRLLMNEHNFPLPANWTYELLADEIIGQPVDLIQLCDILKDITTYGYASHAFHQVLDFLQTVAPPAAAVLGG